jgi:hypothetical protein
MGTPLVECANSIASCCATLCRHTSPVSQYNVGRRRVNTGAHEHKVITPEVSCPSVEAVRTSALRRSFWAPSFHTRNKPRGVLLVQSYCACARCALHNRYTGVCLPVASHPHRSCKTCSLAPRSRSLPFRHRRAS